MLRSSGPFANGSLSDKREFGRIHHVIMNQSQALLHWQNQTEAVGRTENLGGGILVQSHYRKVPRLEIFLEQELRFGLDLGRLALLKKNLC